MLNERSYYLAVGALLTALVGADPLGRRVQARLQLVNTIPRSSRMILFPRSIISSGRH
jgi:hypothetical protein